MDAVKIDKLRRTFENMYGNAQDRRLLLVLSPGRTEIAGNHTDHEGGCVIAGAVDRYVEGIFSANDAGVMVVQSEGYGLVEVDATDLDARPEEHGTTASLVRGMAAQFADRGYAPRGFDAALRSDVLGGSGLSSSAAFELELGQAMNQLWAQGKIPAHELALMAQRAERQWFGKPCGLMDQASVALGGIQYMDFFDPRELKATRLDFDFAANGYAICLVAVGADHAALIGDYAAVPGEMQAVARAFGKERLAELGEESVIERVGALRTTHGDRPVLRTLHYYKEQRLVKERMDALCKGDMQAFLALTRMSGASSAMYLQNVSVAGASEQPAMVALALADELLPEGACRIHGGGFGGTIQAFVPADKIDAFVAGMDAALGKGSCIVCNIDHEGARAQWL
ncbi:MAG: galactokinase family protein [Coriobacteriales bacterium]|nr:galactokinase family protein [Coriobacteriales bacterium]